MCGVCDYKGYTEIELKPIPDKLLEPYVIFLEHLCYCQYFALLGPGWAGGLRVCYIPVSISREFLYCHLYMFNILYVCVCMC